jgi:hypothetical protein
MDTYPTGIKPGALVKIDVMSIYNDYTAKLPSRLSWLTPDTANALYALRDQVRAKGGELYLSDAFRDEQDQAKAHYDYLTGTGKLQEREALVREYPFLASYTACNGGRGKLAYSPHPGFSPHEAGRAVDVDVDPKRLGMDQTAFAELAYSLGWNNIVGGVSGMGDPKRVDVKEEWHWEFRTSVYDSIYVATLSKTGSRKEAYRAMVSRMIKDIKL